MVCKCSITQRLVCGGCEECNPSRAISVLKDEVSQLRQTVIDQQAIMQRCQHSLRRIFASVPPYRDDGSLTIPEEITDEAVQNMEAYPCHEELNEHTAKVLETLAEEWRKHVDDDVFYKYLCNTANRVRKGEKIGE